MSRGRWCEVVEVDGEWVRGQFSRKPTEEDVEAFRELVRAVSRMGEGKVR